VSTVAGYVLLVAASSASTLVALIVFVIILVAIPVTARQSTFVQSRDESKCLAGGFIVTVAITFVATSRERLCRGLNFTNCDSPAVKSRNNHYQTVNR
jgi:hypothetical protein